MKFSELEINSVFNTKCGRYVKISDEVAVCVLGTLKEQFERYNIDQNCEVVPLYPVDEDPVEDFDEEQLEYMVDVLGDAASIGNDSNTEWWNCLTLLYPSIKNGASKEFYEAFKREVLSEFNRFNEDFKIVEKESTRVTTVRRLVHYSEFDYGTG